ncbi:restriction modification system DNA specificity subunit [Clostridium tetanomorphum]|nr:restriction modification system DNA specificity subunit [Clostridium tetanomorphum]
MTPNSTWVSEGNIDLDWISAEYYKKIYLEIEQKFSNGNFKIHTFENIANINRVTGFEVEKYLEIVENGIPYLRVKNVEECFLNFNDMYYIPQHVHEKFKKSQFKQNDIALTITGRVGTAAIITDATTEYNSCQDVVKVSLKESSNIDPYYLTIYLNSDINYKLLNRFQSGASRPRTLINNVRQIKIPVPSQEIQQYIGDKIRKAEILKKEGKESRRIAEQLIYDALDMSGFEDEISESKKIKYNYVEHEDLNDSIDAHYYKRQYMVTNKNIQQRKHTKLKNIGTVDYGYMPMEDYTDKTTGNPMIRVTNMIGNLLLDYSDMKYISNTIDVPEQKMVSKDDILLVQCGNTTGKVAYICEDTQRYIFPSFCLRIRVNSDVIDSRYLALLLELPIMQEQIWQTASYSSVRPNTTKPAIQNLKVPIIEKDKQQEIGELVSKYLSNIYNAKKLVEEAKQNIEDLIEGIFDYSRLNV